MRASPPIDIVLNRSGAWLGFVVAVVLAVMTVVTAWIALALRDLTLSRLAALGLAVLTLALLVSALRLTRRIGGRVRWTGRRWELDDAVSRGGQRRTGDVALAIDLGNWLLLRFTYSDEGGTPRWLPVQRRGHEAQWHALRCALHSSRPASDSS